MIVTGSDGLPVRLRSGAVPFFDPDEARLARQDEWHGDDRVELRGYHLAYLQIMEERRAREERRSTRQRHGGGARA